MTAPERATDIETQAAEWIGRRELDNWSEDDNRALKAWLDASLAHRVAFVRLETSWKRTERLAAFRTPMREQQRIEHTKPGWTLLFRAVAATAVLAVVGAAAATYMVRDNTREFSTPIGGHEVITLTDGSSVELNTDTVLRTRGRFAELVKGEAYFQIKHDAQHPFIVKAGGHSVTDLGTAFIVRNDPNKLTVRLVEGRARIDATDAKGQGTVLTPGDVAVASKGALSVRKASVQQLEDNLGWRRGVLVFDRTTLGEAAAEFNRYNREKLVIADPAAARLTIGGTFPSGNVALFSRVAQAALNLHLETRGADIVVTRPTKTSAKTSE
jgi:transmembrane sensor